MIDFDPNNGINGSADIYVNGIERISDYTGALNTPLQDRVLFGDSGEIDAEGITRFINVNFEIDTNNDGFYDKDNDGIDDITDSDIDGDGASNTLEDLSGTNKFDASSTPEIASVPLPAWSYLILLIVLSASASIKLIRPIKSHE